MLMPIIWLVGVMGVAALVIGISRLSNPNGYAQKIAERASRDEVTDKDRKESKNSGIALVVMSVILVGIAVYVQFSMTVATPP